MPHRFRDPDWHRIPVSAGPWRTWLCNNGSLTARLQARCDRFNVELKFQGLRAPNRDERFLFPAHGRRAVHVREVYLRCGGRTVVFAHSVASPADLRHPWRAVAKLGVRPLGAALFANPRVKRCPLRQWRISARHPLYAAAIRDLKNPPARLWARRSLFVLHRSAILVTEVFLPGILDL